MEGRKRVKKKKQKQLKTKEKKEIRKHQKGGNERKGREDGRREA